MLLAVANPWSKRKGLEDYLALSKLLPDNIRLVLVGLSEEQKKIMPHSIVGLSATQNVGELVMLYSIADVVLNLSYAETFGLTTVEGFACGTPSIVYNVTASPELVTTETGLVIEPGNVSEVVKAVEMTIANGKEKYSEACRERAEQEFDKDKCFEKYVELYESIIVK